MAETKISQLNPNTFELETYSSSDTSLIATTSINTAFNPDTDYIEYFIYNPNSSGLIYPPPNTPANFTDYRLEDNILTIDFEQTLYNEGFTNGSYNVFYNFLSTKLNSNFFDRYYISEISSDRTEIRLNTTAISEDDIITYTNEFIQERNQDNYYPDFYLNFGTNQLVIANNILLDGDTILIKLYDPLPSQYQVNSTLWVVEKVAESLAYLIEFSSEPIIVDNSIKLNGPNLNLKVKGEVNNSTEPTDFTSLTETSLSSSLQQINSFYEDPSIQINVDYTEFSNFINFSSAEKRLNNFFYKIQQIESWTVSAAEGSNVTTVSTSGSTAYYQNLINETIDEFDNYEYFLYFTSGSKSYPKTNSDQPYDQASSTSTLAQNWITSSLATASLYDLNNPDWIYNAIPAYIKEDSANQPYIDFSNMVGHFYDENIWVYIKDITNKWDNDNRIDSGISRDLIAQQLRDLGFNLYENQFSSFNLFVSTLGITPSGSYFPFPNMTGSLPTPSGYEYVNNSITGSNEILPQNDINKRLYKRIYHNLPYLYKKKGTVDGIRALATIYGIPNTLLRIDEFGGKDKTNVNDWDYWFEQFNYAYSTGDDGIISSDWGINTDWGAPDDVPESLQFRFKLPPSSSIPSSQSLWTLNDGNDVRLVLEYDTTLLNSGSFSGSIPNPNNQYANLKFYPNFTTDATEFASVSLPFANNGWWSVMINRDQENFELVAANKIYSGSNGSSLGFIASSSISATDDGFWYSLTDSYFPTTGGITGYDNFSGSYQEIRYYNTQISHSVFKDYVMNPQSIEGNTINSAPDELVFRASLGGELYTGSVSIHPKVTGSWDTVNSFTANSNFTITEGNFETNREYVLTDQPAVGIKNRVTDKIRQIDLNLPEGKQQLSNIRSIQQDTETDDAYTDTVNQVEVVLSPTNQINDDIINSIGYLNIGEYIGDPRQINSGSAIYPDLNDLRDDYFLKYTSNYDWNDFVRLIKFFDNSLWKTIKDFIPSKVSSATGISIKQHLLERQKYPQPSSSYSEPYYTGSIGSIPGLLDDQRIYTSSNDYETFPIEAITASQGGTLPVFVKNTNYTDLVYPGVVNVTQSWSESFMTPSGSVVYSRDDAREFVNGEFSGSLIQVTNGELNPGCDDIKTAHSTPNVTFDINHDTFNGYGVPLNPSIIQLPFSGPAPSFVAGLPLHPSGELDIWWESDRVIEDRMGTDYYYDTFKPKYIAVSKTSKNGLDLTDILPNVKEFTILTTALSPTVTTYAGYQSLTTSVSTIKLTALGIREYNTAYLIEVESDDSIILESIDPAIPYPVVIATQNDVLTVLDPYFDGSFANSDCNPLLNNEVEPRQSSIFWDLDYTSNAIQAVNQQTVITASQQNGNLPKAFIQDYNYYSTPILRRNYLGAKSTSPGFNQNSTSGGFGSLPVVEDLGAVLAQFGSGRSSSPEILNAGNVTVNTLLLIGGNRSQVNTLTSDQNTFTGVIEQSFRSNDNIEAYQYGNDQANIGGLNVVESSIQVPNISSFMIPSHNFTSTAAGRSLGPNQGSPQYGFYLTGDMPIVVINSTTNTYETGSEAGQQLIEDTLYKGILQGEKWYISAYTTMSNPIEYVGPNALTPLVFNSSSYANGDLVDPLGNYGVRQIISASSNGAVPPEYSFWLKQSTNDLNWSSGGYYFGRSFSGDPADGIGVLIWKSNGNGIVVRENTLNNVGSGVVYKEYSNQPIMDNIEDIVTNFGSKTR